MLDMHGFYNVISRSKSCSANLVFILTEKSKFRWAFFRVVLQEMTKVAGVIKIKFDMKGTLNYP